MGGVNVERLTSITDSPPNSEASIQALRPIVTHNRSFFVRSHFPVPKVDQRRWGLVVGGGVGRAREFSYRELCGMPRVAVAATLECAGNGRIGFREPAKGEVRWGLGAVGTARWSGVSLAALLEMVEIRTGATEVVAEGFDVGRAGSLSETIAFSRSIPLEEAKARGTMIALQMNGQPLRQEHGYPARLVVPGWYGMASVKWLKRIRVISGAPYAAYFNGVKYVYAYRRGGKDVIEPVREMRVKSLITSPLEGETLPHGVATTIMGKAWSGDGRLSSVEVDHGSGWGKAELGTSRLGRFAWTTWSARWVPEVRGKTTIMARAADERGNVQPLEPFDNRYQYGYNAVQRVVVSVGR
jgi:DMSO/TMAO reductase YedYZ molybdopterin-dependent catalytic subunit